MEAATIAYCHNDNHNIWWWRPTWTGHQQSNNLETVIIQAAWPHFYQGHTIPGISRRGHANGAHPRKRKWFLKKKKEYGPRYKKREITATIVEGWKNDTCCMGVLRESKSAACSIIISNIIIMFICVFYDCFLQSKSIFSWCGETSRLDIAASWSKDKKLAERII